MSLLDLILIFSRGLLLFLLVVFSILFSFRNVFISLVASSLIRLLFSNVYT